MLKAWDTLVGEARCLFTASVEGGDPEELCEGLVRQVSKLAVGAGGPGTTCRAAPAPKAAPNGQAWGGCHPGLPTVRRGFTG